VRTLALVASALSHRLERNTAPQITLLGGRYNPCDPQDPIYSAPALPARWFRQRDHPTTHLAPAWPAEQRPRRLAERQWGSQRTWL